MNYKVHILLLAALVLGSCKGPEPELSDKQVSVSILPQKYFVESIAGNRVKVNLMIPPGASHSTYEPSAKQMNRLQHSIAYFKSGYLDFEMSWIPRFEGINPRMKIVDLSEGIIPITGMDHHDDDGHQEIHSGTDPHLWLSPANVKIIASNILSALKGLYPPDSAYFNENYKIFIAGVDSVKNLYDSNADQLRGRSFIIYHPALTYLARDYGMDQNVLEFNGKEPPPEHIREIIDLAREKNIHTIFVQQQYSTDNSKSLAREIDASIVQFDPMNENWKEEMVFILNTLLLKSHDDKKQL